MLLTQTRPRTSFPPHLHQQHQQQQQQQLFPHHQQNHFDDLRQPTAFYADSSAIDLDLDGENNPQSISSSPVSTQSLLSQYSNVQTSPLSTFDSIPTTISVAQGIGQGALLDIPSQTTQLMLADSPASIFANNDLMQTDAWTAHGHLTPKSLGRLSHQRESSLSSSLGSAGPASPYSQNTSNPHIAVSDSMGDGFHGLPSGDEYNANYTLVKSFPSATHDTFYSNYPGYTSAESGVISSYPNMAASTKQKSEGGLLPVPGHSIGSNRSRPVSVASSIASDSPATPSEEPRDDGRRKHLLNVVPKLDRTMTDIYSDELFNPNFSVTPTSATQIPVSPGSELFAQRLHAANSQHLGVGHSPIAPTSRGRSPFRHGSPLAPGSSHDFPMSAPQMRFGSVQQLREQNRAVQDARAFQQHVNGGSNMPSPRTISPKDAVLEFNEPGEEMNFPLFPQAGAPGFDNDQLSKAVSHAQQSYNSLSMAGTSFNGYPPTQLGAGIQVPQQYPFIAQPQQQAGVTSMRTGSMATSRTGSTELGHLESSQRSSPQRPQSTAAEGGTYTCTYHGCTLRFETPALLQKHKREGHRQAHGLNGQRKAESSGSALGMTSTLLNSQAGPHRCDRINPSTGKPCNTIFSRPYDLTRHEDTIHNARKQKVRCDLCNEEKTFSRADALTRHYRVCHPDVEFPGKHRRRGGHSA